MRKAAIAAAVVVLLLALTVLIVPRLISIDFLRPRIVAAIEEKTGRTISLSGLRLSLFPGIGVKIEGLTVSGDPPDPDEPLLSVPEGEVRVAIGPLFSGRAEFTRLILRDPRIHFHKYRDGTHSATEIANRLAKKRPPGPVPPPSAEEEKVTVVLRSVDIEDGTLSLRIEEKDGRETRWDVSPFTFRLSGIGGNRHDFEIRTRIEGDIRGEIEFQGKSLRERGRVTDPTFFAISGEGKVFGQKVTVGGKMSAPLSATEADLTIAFPKIEMGGLAGILKDPPRPLAAARLEGLAKASVKLGGSLQSMGVEVEADLTQSGWTLNESPEIRKFIGSPCTLVAQGHYFPDMVIVSNAELRVPPLLLIANASLNPATGAREWAASSRIASLAELGKIRGEGLTAWSPAGRLTASGRGRRDRAGGKEKYDLAIDLGDVGFKVPGRRLEFRALEGHVELRPEEVIFSPLAGLFNGQRFSLRGEASLGAKRAGEVDLRMAYLDVDALFPPEAEGKKKERKPPPAKKEKPAPRKEEGDLSVRANLSIDAGTARGVEFQNLRGKARYEGGTLFLDSVRARMYGGDVAVTGRIGVRALSPEFRVEVMVKDVAAEEILSRKTALSDFVSGPVSLSAEIGGGLRDFDEFTRTGSGSGTVRIAGGRIKGVDLLATAAGLAGIQALAPRDPVAPGTAAKGETRFSDLSADFRVENGRIRTEALTVLSEKMGLMGRTSIGFDRTVDFEGTLRLSRELSGRVRGGAGKFLVGEDGRIEIPLVMTGPLTSPAVAVDTAAIARGATRKFLRGLTDRIPKAAPGAEADNVAPPKGPAKTDPMKEVEGLFRKVLPGGER